MLHPVHTLKHGEVISVDAISLREKGINQIMYMVFHSHQSFKG